MNPYLSPLAAHRASQLAGKELPSYLVLAGQATALALTPEGYQDQDGAVLTTEEADALFDAGAVAAAFASVSAAEALAAVLRMLMDRPAFIEEIAALAGREPRWIQNWIHNALPAGGWIVERIPQPTTRGRPRVRYQVLLPIG